MKKHILAIGDQIANLAMAEAQELSDYLKFEHGIEAPPQPTRPIA